MINVDALSISFPNTCHIETILSKQKNLDYIHMRCRIQNSQTQHNGALFAIHSNSPVKDEINLICWWLLIIVVLVVAGRIDSGRVTL
jgi:hypothetical protein